MLDSARNYIIVLLAAMLVMLGITTFGIKQELKDTTKEKNDLVTELALSHQMVDQVSQNSKSKDDLVKLLDQRFDALKLAEADRTAKIAEAIKKVEEQAAKNVSLSNKILASTPQSSDLCSEANALIVSYLLELQGEEK